MLSQRAIQLIAEARIEAAIERGEFDRLPGLGKPFEFDDMRYDPHWWIRRKVERESIQRLFEQSPDVSNVGNLAKDKQCKKS